MNEKIEKWIKTPYTPNQNAQTRSSSCGTHIGNDKGKQAYRNGFTIVKDPRFINGKNGHWPLGVELEPIYGKIRNTRTYIVTKNEFGKRKFYPKFYKRMKDAGYVLRDNKEILEANKLGLWKKRPMRIQKDGKKITCIALRFNQNKEQWKDVIEKMSVVNVTMRRQIGKGWKAYIEPAKEVVAFADKMESLIYANRFLKIEEKQTDLYWIKKRWHERWSLRYMKASAFNDSIM